LPEEELKAEEQHGPDEFFQSKRSPRRKKENCALWDSAEQHRKKQAEANKRQIAEKQCEKLPSLDWLSFEGEVLSLFI